METSRTNVNHVTCIIELVWELFFFFAEKCQKGLTRKNKIDILSDAALQNFGKKMTKDFD
jgi:hypothetical protein